MTKEIHAEFRGFFYADGSASIVRYRKWYKGKNKTEYWLYRPQITILQREDNLPLLQELKKEFGGSIWRRNVPKNPEHRKEGTKPAMAWTNTNILQCKELCEILLKAKFPYRNYKNVKILNEFLKWRISKGLDKKLGEIEKEMADEFWMKCRQKFHKVKK